MKVIDLNCDLGEGYEDEKLFPYISSCNIASGGHYGDKNSIRKAIQGALNNKVAIGIHPGYPDKENFGRKSMDISLQELKNSLTQQIELFLEICKELGTIPTHIKPHGALYNDLAVNLEFSQEIFGVFKRLLPEVFIFGLSESATKKAASKLGLPFINEVFSDRAYTREKTLVSRTDKGAIISDWSKMKAQVDGLLNGKISTIDGETISLKAQSFCLHGDSPNAVENARKIYEYVKSQGYEVRSYR